MVNADNLKTCVAIFKDAVCCAIGGDNRPLSIMLLASACKSRDIEEEIAASVFYHLAENNGFSSTPYFSYDGKMAKLLEIPENVRHGRTLRNLQKSWIDYFEVFSLEDMEMSWEQVGEDWARLVTDKSLHFLLEKVFDREVLRLEKVLKIYDDSIGGKAKKVNQSDLAKSCVELGDLVFAYPWATHLMIQNSGDGGEPWIHLHINSGLDAIPFMREYFLPGFEEASREGAHLRWQGTPVIVFWHQAFENKEIIAKTCGPKYRPDVDDINAPSMDSLILWMLLTKKIKDLRRDVDFTDRISRTKDERLFSLDLDDNSDSSVLFFAPNEQISMLFCFSVGLFEVLHGRDDMVSREDEYYVYFVLRSVGNFQFMIYDHEIKLSPKDSVDPGMFAAGGVGDYELAVFFTRTKIIKDGGSLELKDILNAGSNDMYWGEIFRYKVEGVNPFLLRKSV